MNEYREATLQDVSSKEINGLADVIINDMDDLLDLFDNMSIDDTSEIDDMLDLDNIRIHGAPEIDDLIDLLHNMSIDDTLEVNQCNIMEIDETTEQVFNELHAGPKHLHEELTSGA